MSTTTTTTPSTTTTVNSELKTIAELKKIPVIVSAVETAPQYYSAFKKTHVVVDTACFFAEKYVQISLAILTSIFFFCFQRPVLHAIDEFAGKYLVRLQETFPAVMTPTDQVYTKCNELYTMTVRTPLKLANEYVKYGTEKALAAKNTAEALYVKYAKTRVDQLYAMACERFAPSSSKSKVY